MNRRAKNLRILRIVLPVLMLAFVLLAWDLVVRLFAIPPYVLPGPGLVLATLIADAGLLWQSLLVTLAITFEGFLLAAFGGIALAIAFNQWRLVEYSFYPYAVILQVTPVVAIAPLLLIWIGYDNVSEVLVVLAWIIAFFTVLSNTITGLRSADHNLIDLMKLYGASRWQVLWRLQLPGAMPYILTGMKISGGLALIGAVTAEFVAGSGTDLGLGWVITLANRNLDTAQEFAALALLSILGIAILFAMTALEWALLHRWHESAVKRES